MTRCALHHLALTASDLGISKKLYSRILPLFGYSLQIDDADLLGWTGPDPEILIYPAKPGQLANKHSTYDPGIHHIAFATQDRSIVERAHELAIQCGCTVLDEPKEYPHYAEGYFATYFLDADGVKLEVAYQPPTNV